jgi:protein-tyrosine phosphatase
VSHVVACGFEQPTPFKNENVQYHKINIADNPGQDITEHFAGSLDFMHKATQEGVCLVHCSAGGSRSVAMIMAFLVVVDGLTADGALEHVCSKRPGVAPNFGFVNQIRNLEKNGCGWKPQS